MIFYREDKHLRAIYFYRYSTEALDILREWNRMYIWFSKPDITLSHDVKLVTAIVMTSAVLENVVGHLSLFPILVPENGAVNSPVRNISAWETYYVRSHQLWANVIPFNLAVSIFVFISNKIGLYAWNYMDLTIVILARAMYFKFKALTLEAEACLLAPSNLTDVPSWRQFTKDHETLCSMLKTINHFLSPLILLSYGKNIYFICIQMHLGLTPQENTSAITTIYAFWSFLHLIARVYLINEAGARIHFWAHRSTELFRKCPNEAYITEVERAERFVSTNTISLSGAGCFNITKPLILRVIGIVFTFEVVLLQASQTPFMIKSSPQILH
ncbi:unnamed protein product [Allacma fusca]|uniref:Gustatory receptor n=1 Tax=Allacma fusca TaxID=39272 RepID=A0A8J2KAA3_9HEXA|nr:unnamed protein product [Allacma fusca]